MNYKKERVYEVKDFVFKILNHWKAMLIAGVVCAVLLGALKYVKDSRSISALEESSKDAKTVAEQVAELPDVKREKIENLVSLNLSLREVSSYKEDAYIMQIDPYHVAEDVLKYEIAAQDDDDITAIKHYYNNEVTSQKVLEQLGDILNVTDDDSSISKCINVSYNNDNEIATDNNVLTITLKSDKKQSSQDMAAIVKDAMKEIAEDASAKCGQHQIKLMSEAYLETVDTDLVTSQTDTDTKIFDLSNRINTLMSSLDDADKTTVESYVNELSEDEIADKDTSETVKPSISKKWIAAGFILGIVMVVGFLGLCWIVDPGIQSPEEFKDNISIDVFGILNEEKRRDLFASLFHKKHARSSQNNNNLDNINLIASKIGLYAEKEGLKSLILSGSCFDKTDENISRIVSNLENRGLTVKLFDQFTQNEEALKETAVNGAVVFVEEIASSTYSDIYEEIDTCKELGIDITGCILMYR